MENDITYNQASGKLYQGGLPLLNKIFRSEADAEDYLKKAGLRLHKTEFELTTPPPHYFAEDSLSIRINSRLTFAPNFFTLRTSLHALSYSFN